jgi:cellobiose-specific phosphotransferase system component IIB
MNWKCTTLMLIGMLCVSQSILVQRTVVLGQETDSKVITVSAQSESSTAEPLQKAEGVLLRYKFDTNSVLHYYFDKQSQMVTAKGEIKQIVKDKTKSNRHFRVIGVENDGSAELEIVVDRVQMETQAEEDVTSSYDSNKPDTVGKDYQKIQDIIGKSMARLIVSNRGQITQVIQAPAGEKIDLDPSLNFLLVLPEEPVTVGHTWKETIEHIVPLDTKPLTMNIKLMRTYEIKKIENQIVSIHFKTGRLTPLRDPKIEVRTMQLLPEGDIEFDLKSGVMLTRKSRINSNVLGAMGGNSSISALVGINETYSDKPAQ